MNHLWQRSLCAGALLLASALAHAQFSWIDDKGLRVFSDRPPPPGTPAARILKRPRGLEAAQPVAAAAAATDIPATGAADKAAVPKWVEQESDYRKRKEEHAKAEEEAAAQRKAEMAAPCAAAQMTQLHMKAGARLARIGKNGEREFLSDEERASEAEKARRTLADCR